MANIVFEKVKIKNFLSFGDAEIELRDRGYVLVSGVNKNPRDGALSNGSGKSSIWSAICWALTGETIQGLSSNVCNLNFLNEGCYVELSFRIDLNEYKITRYRSFGKIGTDLKIFINGEDKSGDGIRKSEALLGQYIPDLTSELIGSVIILGQGLPHRFTNNTPSGRKEVLEKLSKSDFMIEDIKNRISKRSVELQQKRREYENSLIEQNTFNTVFTSQLEKLTAELQTYAINRDFDKEISEVVTRIDFLEKELKECREQNKHYNDELTEINKQHFSIMQLKQNELNEVNKKFNNEKNSYTETLLTLQARARELNSEVIKMKSVKDICPTCGQKICGVIKHDTSQQEDEIKTISEKIKEITTTQQLITAEKDRSVENIEIEFKSKLQEFEIKRTEISRLMSKKSDDINDNTHYLNTENSELSKIKLQKEMFLLNKQNCEKSIFDTQQKLKDVVEKIVYINKESSILDSHILAIDKMNTLVKRDFRGFLLTNVIEFIDKKAREYCSYVFETDEIEFKLDGNSIDISYCGKKYENLSGGEKQKVDLIIQFSIRDMLCQYLNFSSNILVLDEITDNLDSKGCDKIIDLIANKLIDIESVFIISHHSELLKGIFENELCVEKDENGVSKIK